MRGRKGEVKGRGLPGHRREKSTRVQGKHPRRHESGKSKKPTMAVTAGWG